MIRQLFVNVICVRRSRWVAALYAVLLYTLTFQLSCVAYHIPRLSQFLEEHADAMAVIFAPMLPFADNEMVRWLSGGFGGSDETPLDIGWLAIFAAFCAAWSLTATALIAAILSRSPPRPVNIATRQILCLAGAATAFAIFVGAYSWWNSWTQQGRRTADEWRQTGWLPWTWKNGSWQLPRPEFVPP